MITNTPLPAITPGIDYTLIPTKEGWRLTAWESALVTKQRLRPFLWKFEMEFKTWEEANNTLETILAV